MNRGAGSYMCMYMYVCKRVQRHYYIPEALLTLKYNFYTQLSTLHDYLPRFPLGNYTHTYTIMGRSATLVLLKLWNPIIFFIISSSSVEKETQ